MHVPGTDRTEPYGPVNFPDGENDQHRFSRSRPSNSQIAFLPLRVQHIRRNQQVSLLQEVFDLFRAKPVLLAVSPIAVIPFKAGERQSHYREKVYILLYTNSYGKMSN